MVNKSKKKYKNKAHERRSSYRWKDGGLVHHGSYTHLFLNLP